MSKLTQILEVTKYDTNRAQTYFRPDGSITNWQGTNWQENSEGQVVKAQETKIVTPAI